MDELARVHLVYPADNPATTPGAIGWHLREALEKAGHNVVLHDWEATYRIPVNKHEVLLGHPHPSPRTVFRRSVRQTGWARALTLFPFSGDIFQYAFAYDAMSRSDQVAGIMGPEWFRYIAMDPLLRNVRSKIVPVDLAIEPAYFPLLSNRQEEPSRRGVVYIGHTGRYKAPEYLSAIREYLPETRFAWLGPGSQELPGFERLGYKAIASQEARELLADYHVLLSVGHADANPTTVLEALCLGLVPLTTPGSGWSQEQGVVHVPAGDPRGAASIIEAVLSREPSAFSETVHRNRVNVMRDFSWSRFTETVLPMIESPRSLKNSFRYKDARIRTVMTTSQIVAALMGPRIAPAHAYYKFRSGVRRVIPPKFR